MKKLIRILNDITIGIILLVVYIFGVGLTSLFLRLVHYLNKKHKKNTYWEDADEHIEIDYSSSY